MTFFDWGVLESAGMDISRINLISQPKKSYGKIPQKKVLLTVTDRYSNIGEPDIDSTYEVSNKWHKEGNRWYNSGVHDGGPHYRGMPYARSVMYIPWDNLFGKLPALVFAQHIGQENSSWMYPGPTYSAYIQEDKLVDPSGFDVGSVDGEKVSRLISMIKDKESGDFILSSLRFLSRIIEFQSYWPDARWEAWKGHPSTVWMLRSGDSILLIISWGKVLPFLGDYCLNPKHAVETYVALQGIMYNPVYANRFRVLEATPYPHAYIATSQTESMGVQHNVDKYCVNVRRDYVDSVIFRKSSMKPIVILGSGLYAFDISSSLVFDNIKGYYSLLDTDGCKTKVKSLLDKYNQPYDDRLTIIHDKEFKINAKKHE